MNMIDCVLDATNEYINCMPKATRKKYGQFFTSKDTAVFMADLFSIPQDCHSLRILDPGAGSGILATALLERLEAVPEIDTIELVCYENDPNIVELLRSNLTIVCKQIHKVFSYKIITELKEKLKHRIASSSCIIVLSGMYSMYSKWIDFEIDTARAMNKPIIGVRPWGQERIPLKIQTFSNEIVGWNSSSIINAVRKYAI